MLNIQIGHLNPVCKEKFGPDVRIQTINPVRRMFPLPFLQGFTGTAMVEGLVDAVADRLEERALFGRYGL